MSAQNAQDVERGQAGKPRRLQAEFCDMLGLDLLRADDKTRIKTVGRTIRLARENGIEFRHRPQGWSLRFPGDEEWTDYWPVDVNLFVDDVHEEIADQAATRRRVEGAVEILKTYAPEALP